ncbi:MAG TPA: SIR2 family protein, partial [Terriglobales bacterium]|nr:SIR2 family protein [Terriglobales bacterium]
QDLQESLSLDKHPVALLIGAGCASSVRVKSGGGTCPLIADIAGLTTEIKASLSGEPAFDSLVSQFAQDGVTSYTIEDLLSRVRLLRRIVGNGDARGLKSADLIQLEKRICRCIVDAVWKSLPSNDTPYHDLADWIGGIPRGSPIQLFTTNYDLLLEQALEDRCLPYFDGFVGTRTPFFDLRAIEDDQIPARWTRLWKLHGCASWRLEPDGKVTRNCQATTPGEGLLIHPSELKYDQSRRMPYLAMIDRLRAFLRQPSAFLVTSGYAFADEHLNEVIIEGLRSNSSAAAFGLMFKNLEDEGGALALSKRIPSNLSLLARDRGVVRAINAEWLVGPSGATAPPATNNLGDFKAFAGFLKSFVRNNGV